MDIPHSSIIITGHARGGKDSIGKYLVENYGYTRLAFADAMKRMYHELFGAAEPGVKVRDDYIWFGETMRQRDPRCWIRKLAEVVERELRLNLQLRAADRVFDGEVRPKVIPVITDLRFPLEYEWARQNSYVIIRVICPYELRFQRMMSAGDIFTPETAADISEKYIDEFDVDYEIVNDGTLGELYAKVDAIMGEIGRDSTDVR